MKEKMPVSPKEHAPKEYARLPKGLRSDVDLDYSNRLAYWRKMRHLENRTFDYAIPQPWADEVREVTGFYPPGDVVWDYTGDITSTWGSAYPVSNHGANVLRLYMSCLPWAQGLV